MSHLERSSNFRPHHPTHPIGLSFAGPLTSLQPLLLRLTSSPSPLHRLTTYQLLSATPSLLCHAPTISGTQDQPAVVVTPEQVANVLEMGIGDQIVQVRVEAVKAICQVLGSSDAMDKKGRERVGKGLVEKVVQVSGKHGKTRIDLST